jgi:NAD(P)-dependent dehydrogenase (short-subunit alcohol dehydrogenase family)
MRALVTGAARGIGAAIAARLRDDGLEVVTLDLLPGCDIALDLATDALPDFGDVDVCVSNAAITDTVAPAHRMSAEQWARDIDVNLTGAFRVVQACLPGMRERRYGRVVAISSGAALGGLPGQVAYAASKAGLLGMVKTIAAENAGRGITANAVLPGMVATEKVLAMPAGVLERVIASLPAGRMAEPAEVAALVSFLASAEAGYVTGQEIGIDGGAGLNTMTLGSARER